MKLLFACLFFLLSHWSIIVQGMHRSNMYLYVTWINQMQICMNKIMMASEQLSNGTLECYQFKKYIK